MINNSYLSDVDIYLKDGKKMAAHSFILSVRSEVLAQVRGKAFSFFVMHVSFYHFTDGSKRTALAVPAKTSAYKRLKFMKPSTFKPKVKRVIENEPEVALDFCV